MISNPPYGVDWKPDKTEVKNEADQPKDSSNGIDTNNENNDGDEIKEETDKKSKDDEGVT